MQIPRGTLYRKIWLRASLISIILLLALIWLSKSRILMIGSDVFEEKPDIIFENKTESMLYPSDWAWRQRTFPFGKADKKAHLEALQQAQAMRHSRIAKSTNLEWEFAGPTNIGGRVSDIEFNPLNANIVYAGAATGGVFKSTDGGESWFPVFDEQAVLPIGDLAVDPLRPEVVYAGTGESHGVQNNFPGGGVYKSTNGGETWQASGLEATAAIGRIVIDPIHSDRVYVAAVGSAFDTDQDRGVYRSTNGGLDWEKVLFVNDSTGAVDLVINPQTPSLLYAATWQRLRLPTASPRHYGNGSGIYRSYDGGDTWELLDESNGLPGTGNRIGRIGLALCQSQPDQLYALYTDGSTYSGLFRTRDGGNHWENADPDSEFADHFGSFSWYFGNVRVKPDDPETVYVLDIALSGSTDGGNTVSFLGVLSIHVDQHALAFDPRDSQRLIVGNDGGINISSDGGSTWTEEQTLPITQFYHITMDVTNPERLYGGTQDNGTMRTLTGNLNDWRIFYGGDGFYVIVDPNNPDIIYAESQFGLLSKSTDGGRTFRLARTGIDPDEPTNWSTPVVMDPNDSRVLYYGTNRVYRTDNGAASWYAISDNLSDGTADSYLGTMTTIAVAPSNSGVIYAGTDDSHVWVTADTGATWTDISAALPFRWVTRVAVDPNDEMIAYVTFSGLKWNSPQPHVFRTTDMGSSWEDISSNLPDAPVNTIVVDPSFPDNLYVGTDVGAYHSTDAGQSWAPLGQGMPTVSVYDLFIHPTLRQMVAGTHGRSMYKIDLVPLTDVREAAGEGPAWPSSPRLFHNYPNPFNPETTIKYQLPMTANVKLEIFNLLGQKVSTLVDRKQSAGFHSARWDGRNEAGAPVSSGVYLYRVEVGEFVQTRKLTLLR